MMPRIPPERFDEMVIPEPNSGCHLWTGPVSKGYGTFGSRWKGRDNAAHRLSFERANGPIPSGLFVLHRCDTKCCVNPDHLFLGTVRDNALDASRKGLLPGNRKNANKTECLRGHPFNAENTYNGTDGNRHCIQCKRDTRRAWRAERRAKGMVAP